jgi:hypothetical protein
MTRERFLHMEDIIALSWINTKLRDQYEDLDNLCEDLDFDIQQVKEKFKKIEYKYVQEQNKFV